MYRKRIYNVSRVALGRDCLGFGCGSVVPPKRASRLLPGVNNNKFFLSVFACKRSTLSQRSLYFTSRLKGSELAPKQVQ